MSEAAEAQGSSEKWAWTLGSGLLTLAFAGVAAMLPAIDWAPRGGLVGWLLFLGGAAEFALGMKRRGTTVGAAAIGSGLITAAAGLVFVARPFAEFFPVANIVLAWLLVRGAWMFVAAQRVRSEQAMPWLALSGAVDLMLAVLLIVGLPIAAFVASMFGPTPEMVASFSLVLAVSFLATGLSQVAVAMSHRRQER